MKFYQSVLSNSIIIWVQNLGDHKWNPFVNNRIQDNKSTTTDTRFYQIVHRATHSYKKISTTNDSNRLCNALTNIKGTDGEWSCNQLIHHNLPCHCLYSTSRQHPLQPPEPVVVEVGMEAEADSRHSCSLTPVDASWVLGSCSVFPSQHTLLYEVSRGEQRCVSQDVTDVRMSLERSPGPVHGEKSEQREDQSWIHLL